MKGLKMYKSIDSQIIAYPVRNVISRFMTSWCLVEKRFGELYWKQILKAKRKVLCSYSNVSIHLRPEKNNISI